MKKAMSGTAPSVARRVKRAADDVRKPRAISPQRRASSGSGPTPNAILDAALRIFARDGYDGASIPAIAKAASIGHPLVHYHFGSKDNLWRAAVDYAFGDLSRSMAVLEEAAGGLEPVEALKMLCRGFAQFTARHPLHMLIILNELRAGGERFEWLVERYLRPLHARLDRVIDAAVATGRIRPVPAREPWSLLVPFCTLELPSCCCARFGCCLQPAPRGRVSWKAASSMAQIPRRCRQTCSWRSSGSAAA